MAGLLVPKLVHFLKSPKIGTKKVPQAGLKSPKIRTLNNIIYNIIFNIIFNKKYLIVIVVIVIYYYYYIFIIIYLYILYIIIIYIVICPKNGTIFTLRVPGMGLLFFDFAFYIWYMFI